MYVSGGAGRAQKRTRAPETREPDTRETATRHRAVRHLTLTERRGETGEPRSTQHSHCLSGRKTNGGRTARRAQTPHGPRARRICTKFETHTQACARHETRDINSELKQTVRTCKARPLRAGAALHGARVAEPLSARTRRQRARRTRQPEPNLHPNSERLSHPSILLADPSHRSS